MQTGGSYPPFVTSYTYDALNHLIQVSMPRGTTTQTRSFSYNKTVGTTLTVGGDLLSATNPENGTVTYTYDGNRGRGLCKCAPGAGAHPIQVFV